MYLSGTRVATCIQAARHPECPYLGSYRAGIAGQMVAVNGLQRSGWRVTLLALSAKGLNMYPTVWTSAP
jgi:hypothetical protein